MSKALISLSIQKTVDTDDADAATDELVKKLEGEGWNVSVESVDEDDGDDTDEDDDDDGDESSNDSDD